MKPAGDSNVCGRRRSRCASHYERLECWPLSPAFFYLSTNLPCQRFHYSILFWANFQVNKHLPFTSHLFSIILNHYLPEYTRFFCRYSLAPYPRRWLAAGIIISKLLKTTSCLISQTKCIFRWGRQWWSTLHFFHYTRPFCFFRLIFV